MIIRKSKFILIEEKLWGLLSLLDKFNTLIRAENLTGEEVKTFLKCTLQNDTKMDKFFTEMFQIGEAMYLLGSHCSFIKTLVSNPEWMAEKCVGTTGDVCKFKAEPHNQGSEDLFGRIMFLERKSYTSQVPKSAKRNLAQLLDSLMMTIMRILQESSQMSRPKHPLPGKRVLQQLRREGNKSKNKHCMMDKKESNVFIYLLS